LGEATAAALGGAVVAGSIVTRPLGGALAHGGGLRVAQAGLAGVAVGATVLVAAPWPAAHVVAMLLVGACAGLPYAAVVDRTAALVPAAPGSAVGFAGTAGTLVGMAGVVLIGVAVDHGAVDLMLVGLAVHAALAALATGWAAREP